MSADGRCAVIVRGRTIRHFADEGTLRDTLLVLLPSAFRKRPILATPETFGNFLIRNTWRESVTRSFRLNGRYEIATDIDLRLFGDPVKFDNRFPDNCGYVELSAVGFNTDRTEALFRADHFCGLCGGGGYVLMRKNQQEWRIVTWDLSWVS